MANKLRQYLLGSLPKQESEKIDVEIISGSVSEEELRLAENDLMEDYIENALSPEEIMMFRKNFLVGEQRESEIEMIALLKNYAQKPSPARSSNESSSSYQKSFFQRFKEFFNLRTRPATALVPVFSILIIMIGVFFYSSSKTNETAELNKKDFSDITPLKELSGLSLTPGVFRESGKTPALPADKLTEQILLRIVLPFDVKFENRFNVKIFKEQNEIVKLEQIRLYNNQNLQELRLILPSSLLSKGDYKVEVSPENAQNTTMTYPFEIR